MAKKNSKVVLEDVELKPQVIGQIYEKKTNIGRVIFIFIILLIMVYFINDISLFVNNLLGKESATSIKENTKDNDDKHSKDTKPEDEYYALNDNLVVVVDDLTITHFSHKDNVLSFDAYNYTENDVDLSNKNYFLETYDNDKKLLNTLKVDFNNIVSKNKVSLNLSLNKEFAYLKFVEKNKKDYPEHSITSDTLKCINGNSSIVYTFKDNELISLKDIYNDYKNTDGYYLRYTSYQERVTKYNNMNGIIAEFTITTEGFTTNIDVDLSNANITTLNEKYYFSYKEKANVVYYEMTSYGYVCN